MRYNRQLYASGFTTADNVVSTQIPIRSVLAGIYYTDYQADAAASGAMAVEFSLLATSQFAVNEAENVLAQIRSVCQATLLIQTNNLWIPIGVMLNPGQRVYMHRLQVTAPDTFIVAAQLVFQ